MARIKIEDLPKDMKISKNDMRKITGGALITKTGIESSLTQTSSTQTTNTTYEDSNKMASDCLNVLSTVLKNMTDTENSVTRNMG